MAFCPRPSKYLLSCYLTLMDAGLLPDVAQFSSFTPSWNANWDQVRLFCAQKFRDLDTESYLRSYRLYGMASVQHPIFLLNNGRRKGLLYSCSGRDSQGNKLQIAWPSWCRFIREWTKGVRRKTTREETWPSPVANNCNHFHHELHRRELSTIFSFILSAQELI